MSRLYNVLFLVDDFQDRETVSRLLKRSAIPVSLHHVSDKKSFESALAECRHDIILTDFSVKNYSGIEALTAVRAISEEIPFIILSGALSDETAIQAIRMGASDFIPKQQMPDLIPSLRLAINDIRAREERQATEAALRASEIKYSSLFQLSRDAVFILDINGNINEANQQAVASFRSAEAQIRRANLSYFMAERDREKICGALAGLHEGGIFQSEAVFRRSDGKDFPGDIHLSRVDLGDQPCVLATIRDLSEQKRLEILRRQEDTNVKLRELTGTIVHEFAQPLQVIDHSFEFLRAEHGSSKYLDICWRNIKRVISLVHDLRHIVSMDPKDSLDSKIEHFCRTSRLLESSSADHQNKTPAEIT